MPVPLGGVPLGLREKELEPEAVQVVVCRTVELPEAEAEAEAAVAEAERLHDRVEALAEADEVADREGGVRERLGGLGVDVAVERVPKVGVGGDCDAERVRVVEGLREELALEVYVVRVAAVRLGEAEREQVREEEADAVGGVRLGVWVGVKVRVTVGGEGVCVREGLGEAERLRERLPVEESDGLQEVELDADVVWVKLEDGVALPVVVTVDPVRE